MQTAIAQSTTDDVNDRLNGYVSKYNITLDEVTTTKIVEGCVEKQNKLRLDASQNDIAVRKRIAAYSQIQDEVKAIQLRMMRQGVDTSELDLFNGKLQAGQDSLTLAADSYGTAADDLLIIDCQKKPLQFKAGVLELNSLLNEIRSESADLRSIVHNSQESTLNPLKKRLSI